MKRLSKLVCLVGLVFALVDLGEARRRLRSNVKVQKRKRERLPELRSLPYEDIMRFISKRRRLKAEAQLQADNSTLSNDTATLSNDTTTTTPKPPEVVCYGDLGCFSNEYPFDNTGAVPQSPEYIDTMFYVFTRSNPTIDERQAISYEDPSSLRLSHFNPRNPVKVLIHGFFSYDITGDPFWSGDAMREMLKRDDVNVIIVDWNKGAAAPNYFAAASNTRVVAAQLAKLITFLIDETGCSLDQFHLIGHSLGAHTSGYVGHRLPGLPRITGLDPAEPFFEDEDPVVRLDPTDAQFVDVIHTDGGEVLSGAWGLDQPSGHVDFYPNGGKGQPGCGNTWLGAITSLFDSGSELTDAFDCSHKRAHELWVDSINSPCKFVAYPCRDYDDFVAGNCWDCSNDACAMMGYDVDSNMAARGSLYLSTAETPSYCSYEYRVELATKARMDFCRGQIMVNIGGTYQSTGPKGFFADDTYGLDENTSYVSILSSTVRIDKVKQLALTYTSTSSWLLSWGVSADLYIARIEVQSNTGISASFCGETLLRSGEMTKITTFNNC